MPGYGVSETELGRVSMIRCVSVIKNVLAAILFVSSFAAQADTVCVPPLPVAHSNNAVATMVVNGEPALFSFTGL